MKELGKKLAAGGFLLQGAAGALLGLLYLFAAESLTDIFLDQIVTGGAAARAAGALSTLSGVGMILAAAGFALRYVELRRGSDLTVAALMILSLMIAFFTPAYAALQPVLGWAYMAVMAFTALRRKKLLLFGLVTGALALQVAGGPLASLLPDTPALQGILSAAVSACCYAALALYVWRVDAKPEEKKESKT